LTHILKHQVIEQHSQIQTFQPKQTSQMHPLAKDYIFALRTPVRYKD